MKRLRKLTDSLPSLLEEGEEEESENQHVTFQNDQDVCEPIKDKITNGEKPRSRQTRKQRVQK